MPNVDFVRTFLLLALLKNIAEAVAKQGQIFEGLGKIVTEASNVTRFNDWVHALKLVLIVSSS